MAEPPLVSVGIPTFNRVEHLRRAVASVLAQTHANVELVISDNASSDGTELFARELVAQDRRVRYLRSATNRGPTANFNTLFEEVRGAFVMMLSDDDWLQSDYVERCLSELRARPDHVLVCGVARYVVGGEPAHTATAVQLGQEDARARVVEYLRHVDENGLFYGLMPADVLRRAAPLRNVLGNDWLLVIGVIVQGKAASLKDTAIVRELGGTSADIPRIASTLSLPRWQARVPHLVMAWHAFAEVAWRTHGLAPNPRTARLPIAFAAARQVLDWRADVWHLTMPTFARARRRPGGERLWRAYSWVARRAGAAQSGNDT
jgi:glycosyltransferase involved in cell wall biosynthesis